MTALHSISCAGSSRCGWPPLGSALGVTDSEFEEGDGKTLYFKDLGESDFCLYKAM
jgi:hypothetical protein